jgi:phage terminase small subunit
MPVLSNARHERFAQEIASSKSYFEAHKSAGFKPNDGNASKLAARPEIQARVKEIKGKGAERAEVTLSSLIEEAAQIQRAALAAEEYGAAVAALTAKAKLAGLWIERGEHNNTNVLYGISDQPLTEDEWAAKHVTEH